MTKKKKVREAGRAAQVERLEALYSQREVLMEEMRSIDDAVQAREEGQRTLSDEERGRMEQLEREVDTIDHRVRMFNLESESDRPGADRGVELVRMVREAVDSRRVLEIQLDQPVQRSAGTQNLASVDPLIPVKIQDIIEPLEQGLIYNRVGIRLQTGLAGNYVWPVVGSVEASLVGEAVELDDEKYVIVKQSDILAVVEK